MATEGARAVRLRTQVLLSQIVVVALTLGVAFAVFGYLSDQRLRDTYGQRALAIARTVAADPVVRAEVARYAPGAVADDPAVREELTSGPLERLAVDATQRNAALFVVITDDAGIRLAHPDPSRLAEHVSTDPSEALAGRESITEERGTLGDSVRAKVPVLAPDSGNVVGAVSVGISTDAVHDQLLDDLRTAGVLVGAALLVGIVGSILLARRWRGLTLGLEPDELAELVRGQAAVLHGIGGGVLAVDASWRTTFVNDEARRLLGIAPDLGRPVEEIGLTPRVLEAFRNLDEQPASATVGSHIVIISARRVSRDGRDLGAVLTVRDRTDVESLTRQLDAVQSMSTVLRAQRHEFSNKMHLISGLLHSGRVEEASRSIDELIGAGPLGAATPGIDAIHDAYLQAFLAAKAAHARENGVELVLGPNTWVEGSLADPVDVTTVLGNLLDNAMEAVRDRDRPVRQVEVELVQEDSTLHITVADSGDGVAPDLVDTLFTEGISTREDHGVPGGRGVGLALIRQIARAHGGDVRLSSPGGGQPPLTGAEFIARIPGVLVESEVPWPQQL
ncbi:sensor histidine kinase [Nocardia sp. NBC_00508]|uniref:sensor histidine kinase n=1 Tax=Nocardia sp. NBC_00508 TaxID=2975992 RepID=UPI002E809F80|nr:sensor histidine kinase [Nocardia sp. NBC_00508]WUD67159.1 sensor histidine kinase [Nocardia sp. NBC_00508]